MKKICGSPAGTFCTYQRKLLARDQADPDDNNAAPLDDNGSDAYEELSKFLQANLSPDVLGQAQALLERFVDKSATDDEPSSISGRPGAAQAPGAMSMDQRLAIGAQIRRGRRLAEGYLFDKRYPNAGRIRNV